MIANSRVWHSRGQPAYVREGLDRSNYAFRSCVFYKITSPAVGGGQLAYTVFFVSPVSCCVRRVSLWLALAMCACVPIELRHPTMVPFIRLRNMLW